MAAMPRLTTDMKTPAAARLGSRTSDKPGRHSSVRFNRPVAFSRNAISLRSPAFSSAYLSGVPSMASPTQTTQIQVSFVSERFELLDIAGDISAGSSA